MDTLSYCILEKLDQFTYFFSILTVIIKNSFYLILIKVLGLVPSYHLLLLSRYELNPPPFPPKEGIDCLTEGSCENLQFAPKRHLPWAKNLHGGAFLLLLLLLLFDND